MNRNQDENNTWERNANEGVSSDASIVTNQNRLEPSQVDLDGNFCLNENIKFIMLLKIIILGIIGGIGGTISFIIYECLTQENTSFNASILYSINGMTIVTLIYLGHRYVVEKFIKSIISNKIYGIIIFHIEKLQGTKKFFLLKLVLVMILGYVFTTIGVNLPEKLPPAILNIASSQVGAEVNNKADEQSVGQSSEIQYPERPLFQELEISEEDLAETLEFVNKIEKISLNPEQINALIITILAIFIVLKFLLGVEKVWQASFVSGILIYTIGWWFRIDSYAVFPLYGAIIGIVVAYYSSDELLRNYKVLTSSEK